MPNRLSIQVQVFPPFCFLISFSLSLSVSLSISLSFPPFYSFCLLDSRIGEDTWQWRTNQCMPNTYTLLLLPSERPAVILVSAIAFFSLSTPPSSHFRHILMPARPPPISCYCVSYYRLPSWNAYLSITNLTILVEMTLPEAEKTEWMAPVWMRTTE